MTSPIDHLGPAAAGLALVALPLPLILLTLGVLVLAVISACSPTSARARHSRRLIQDLTEYAKVLKSR